MRTEQDTAGNLDLMRDSLSRRALSHAVLSHPETLAGLGCFETPVEDWPVANPFAPVAALLCISPRTCTLVVADMYLEHVIGPLRTTPYRSYEYRVSPTPLEESKRALLVLFDELGVRNIAVGIEASHLPYCVGDWLREVGLQLEPCDDAVGEALSAIQRKDLTGVHRACRLADVVQQAVKDHATPGISAAELAGVASAAMFREAGRRVPAILMVASGPEATAAGGGAASGRVIEPGDLVLCDTAPWIAGMWADSANTVCVGRPDAITIERFDAVRRALDVGIAACKPGVSAKDVDVEVRGVLAEHGPLYTHHTGHGIGAAWSIEPAITPESEDIIEEGMVLALEPAIYRPGWGGIRLEHVIHVRELGNDVLTSFEHTL